MLPAADRAHSATRKHPSPTRVCGYWHLRELAASRTPLPPNQFGKETQRLADRQQIVRLQVEQMRIVGDKMRRIAIERAEEKGDVVGIHRIVPQVSC